MVRQAIFSILENTAVDWCRVLDLYAGSGTLGIEALSRNAEWADFVDQNRKCCDIIKRNLEKAQDRLQVAQANYNLAVIGIDDSAAQDAEIKVTNAQVALANEPIQLQQSQLALAQAHLKLESAQRTLEQTVLIAPVDGTVMDIAAVVGESVGGGPFITLADLETPLVRFWVEEMDMISVAAGNPVNVVFEALPDYTFSGEIVRVDPALVTVENTPAVQVWASVDLTSQPVNLLSGMTAEVEIVAGEAKGALLVPVQALRELTPGQYAVFIVKPDGELEMRSVEVGLRDFVNAEILSGLELGEIVSTGMAESVDTSSAPAGDGTIPGNPIMRMLGGG